MALFFECDLVKEKTVRGWETQWGVQDGGEDRGKGTDGEETVRFDYDVKFRTEKRHKEREKGLGTSSPHRKASRQYQLGEGRQSAVTGGRLASASYLNFGKEGQKAKIRVFAWVLQQETLDGR
jgi:hypothetical protein